MKSFDTLLKVDSNSGCNKNVDQSQIIFEDFTDEEFETFEADKVQDFEIQVYLLVSNSFGIPSNANLNAGK